MHVRSMQIVEFSERTGLSLRTIRFPEGNDSVGQRVTELHGSCSTAAVAAHLRQQIERLQLLPEARR